MPSAFRYQNIALGSVVAAVTISAAMGSVYGILWSRVPDMPDTSAKPDVPASYALIPFCTGQVWMAFQSRPEKKSGPSVMASSQDRYRLAGTFIIEGAGEPQRKAIIDDLAKHDQSLVSEGDRLDDSSVRNIFYDHVILLTPAGLRELWVDFAGRTGSNATVLASNPADGHLGATNKFGCVKVQDNRWMFSRKPILDYYQELLDEPDRMVAIFDTMKPVRDEKSKITGYVVGIEGEKAFFDSVGLQQGDIVRAVNSFPMTNRRRAEAFIDQFLKDQMNAVVLDVERGGNLVKQVYQVQP